MQPVLSVLLSNLSNIVLHTLSGTKFMSVAKSKSKAAFGLHGHANKLRY